MAISPIHITGAIASYNFVQASNDHPTTVVPMEKVTHVIQE